MIICPNCGTENLFDGATQCKKCLAQLASQKKPSPANEEKPTPENAVAGKSGNPPTCDTDTQPLPPGMDESSAADKNSDFEIQEVNFDSGPADITSGQPTEQGNAADIKTEDKISPEPIEKEMTLYRDEELQVRMEQTENGPAITLTNRADFEQPESSATIQQPETIIPALNEKDLLAIPTEEQQNVTKKIIINPNLNKKNLPAQSYAKTENKPAEPVKDDVVQAPEPTYEKPSSEFLDKISGEQFKFKSVAFFNGNVIKLSGVKLTNGDQFVINEKEFELKEKVSNRFPLYGGIVGGLLLLAMVIIYLINATSSPSGQIVGVIKDPASGQLLTGITVTIKELNRQTQITPAGFFIFDNIPEGIYTIEARPEGYPVISDRLTVIKKLTSTASFSIEQPNLPPPATQNQAPIVRQSESSSEKTGTLKLSLTPRDTKVYIDGRYIGQGNRTLKIALGEHRLSFGANGYEDQNRDVEISENTTKNYNISLDKKTTVAIPAQKSPLQIASELEGAGNFDNALAKYIDIVRTEPANIQAIFGQARCYRARGDNSNALSNYLKAARMAGDKNDIQTQLQALSGVLEINPNYLTALYSRGLIYLNQGDFTAAAQDFSKVIEIDSRHLNAHYKLAEAYYKSKDYGAALQTYEQTMNLNFTDPKPLAYMAEIYLAMGDLKSTKKYYDRFEKGADAPTRARFNSDPEWQRVKAAIGK